MANQERDRRLPVPMRIIAGIQVVSIVAFVVAVLVKPGTAPLIPSLVFFTSTALIGAILTFNLFGLASRSIPWSQRMSGFGMLQRSGASTHTSQRLFGLFFIFLGSLGFALIMTGQIATS